MKTFAGTAPGERSYQAFAAPEDILVDHDLAAEERRRLLDAWKLELERAGESEADFIGRPQELLRRVNACRRLLSEQED
jgi:hypothetical protein